MKDARGYEIEEYEISTNNHKEGLENRAHDELPPGISS
jgi:hypothetical protein